MSYHEHWKNVCGLSRQGNILQPKFSKYYVVTTKMRKAKTIVIIIKHPSNREKLKIRA